MDKPLLSIIILTYKCRDVFKVALDSVLTSVVNFNYEIIIVDNGSEDGTVEMLENNYLNSQDKKINITLIKNTNEGFAKGNNRGLLVRQGEYVLFLNPDTKLMPNTLQVMMDFMRQNPGVGVSTCKLITADGTLDRACRRSFPSPLKSFFRLSGLSLVFPNSKIFSGYNLSFENPDNQLEIDSCSGAFALLSPECINSIKGFDENYFMYGEDLDLCMRAKLAGFRVVYYPHTYAYHYRGQSSKGSKKVIYAFHEAMWIFYKKYYRKKYLYILDLPMLIAIWGRYIIKLSIHHFKS